MRALITGQAGTRKKQLADCIVRHALQQRGITRDPEDPISKAEIRWFEVEDDPWLRPSFKSWLTTYNESTQLREWRLAFEEIRKEIDNHPTKDCLLLVHASCYHDRRFFSSLCWDDILTFRPECIITLIDDIYDIWQRIEEGSPEAHFSLEEIIAWRSVETCISRALSQNVLIDPAHFDIKLPKKPKQLTHFFGTQIPHFVMSIKHPVETFYRLLFERDKRPIVYASFPITRTRKKPKRREDINTFRRKLFDEGAIVIDPLSIDELRLAKPVKDQAKERWIDLTNASAWSAYCSQRWPLGNESIPGVASQQNPFATLSNEQIISLALSIDAQIISRDFFLVAQSEWIIAYRPFYPEKGAKITGKPTSSSSGGVTQEVTFSLDLYKKVLVFHPRCDFCEEQRGDLFSDRAVWGRTELHPRRDQLDGLPETDFNGLEDILSKVRQEVRDRSG